MANDTIREYCRVNGVCLWQVADALGMRDSNLSKLLRYPLSPKKENEICAIIDKIAAERKEKEDE